MDVTLLSRKELGNLGETVAAEYLESANYDILCRNYSCRSGEVDIIAHERGKNCICFAEVKTRRTGEYGSPAEAVSYIKRKHIRRVATFYLLREWDNIGANATTEFRFDVLEVAFESEEPRVNHIPAAFS